MTVKDYEESMVKVIGFPGHEAMWVEVTSGNKCNGSGLLRNQPICSSLKYDDLIHFETPEEREGWLPIYAGCEKLLEVYPSPQSEEDADRMEIQDSCSINRLAAQAMEEAEGGHLATRYGCGKFQVYLSEAMRCLIGLTNRSGHSIGWLLDDIGLHANSPLEREVTDADHEAFPHYRDYMKLWERYGEQYSALQMWTLEKAHNGARLCIHGGVDDEGDRSCHLYPVAEYKFADVPWGYEGRFTFMVGRHNITKGQINSLEWMAFLRSEY